MLLSSTTVDVAYSMATSHLSDHKSRFSAKWHVFYPLVTALREKHVLLLSRIVDNIYLYFDGGGRQLYVRGVSAPAVYSCSSTTYLLTSEQQLAITAYDVKARDTSVYCQQQLRTIMLFNVAGYTIEKGEAQKFPFSECESAGVYKRRLNREEKSLLFAALLEDLCYTQARDEVLSSASHEAGASVPFSTFSAIETSAGRAWAALWEYTPKP